MTEKELQAAVIEAAHLFGWRVAHFRPALTQSGKWATAMQGDPGYPDLTMARDGEILFVELKSETGRIRPEQKIWIDALTPHVVVWRPSDWINGTIVDVLR